MVGFAMLGGDPALVAVGITEELLVAEIAAEKAELPEVVGDVLADVADGAVRADDDLGVFVGARFLFRRVLRALALVGCTGRVITQQPLFLPSVSK